MASANIPKTMKGVWIEKTGGTDVLQYREDIPVPTPADGQVLIKNEFVGINYIDTYFRTGVYPLPQTPYILGREGSGTIIAHGPGSIPADLPIGARVAYSGTSAYAEYVTVPVGTTMPVPDGISSEVAAASLLQALTAVTLIREAHPVQKGDWVLVTAAAGGVGLWLVQLLKAVGARTIAVASSEEKRALAKENGAEVVLGYYEDDRSKFTEEVLKITGGEGVSAAFDSVGKVTFDSSLAAVKRRGSMVSFGNASGPVEGFALGRLAAKNIKLLRPTLFNYVFTREEYQYYTNEVWKFIEQDKLNVHIHEVYPIKDVVRATLDIESRKTTGKLLLKV